MEIVITPENLKQFIEDQRDILYDKIDLTTTIDYLPCEDRPKYIELAFRRMRIGGVLTLQAIDPVLFGKHLVFKTIELDQICKIMQERKSLGEKKQVLDIAELLGITFKFAHFSYIYYLLTFKREK